MIFKREIRISSKKTIKGSVAQRVGICFVIPAILAYGAKMVPEGIATIFAFISLAFLVIDFGLIIYYVFIYKPRSGEVAVDGGKKIHSKAGKIGLIIFVTVLIAGASSLATFFFLKKTPLNLEAVKVVSENNEGNELKLPKQGEIPLNKTSKEYALMGARIWPAVKCSTWASYLDKKEESQKLFVLAYSDGQEFMDAVRADKISDEDWNNTIPMIIGLTMRDGGPSNDFMLGRIFDNAQSSAFEVLNMTDGKYNSDDVKKLIAETEFQKANCDLIR